MSDEEGSDPESSPAASPVEHGGAERLSKPQQAQQLVNCLMVWRFESGEVEAEPQAAEDSEMIQSEQQE